MFLINGREQNYLTASDRAIQFGDGSFTTARIIDGYICLYDAHVQRLYEDCKKLFIPFTQWDTLKVEMRTLAASVSCGVLKVIISRGSGGRGYDIDGCLRPSRIVSILPYPDHYKDWRNSGIKLTLSPVRLGRNPMLAGIKHLNRLEQVFIRIHLKRSDAHEALVLDSEEVITECCVSNLFWRQGDSVFTPLVDQAGVNGVMRQFCLAQLAHSSFRITEVHAKMQQLRDADEVIICNSLMPIVPVHTYEDINWTSRELYQFLTPLCEQI